MALVPYRTCKLFGAIRVVLGIRGSVVLIHGPRGCAYHIRYLLGVRGPFSGVILTTQMDERDVIFGASEKLQNAILQVDREYSPELIAVLTSCASSIIGEDVDSVIRSVKDDVEAKVIFIPAGGFEGDHIDGYKEALNVIVKNLVSEPERRLENSVNLVGLYRFGPDVEDLLNLLSKLKVDVNGILTVNSSLDVLRRLSEASLNVIMCEASGFEAAHLMEKLYNIPFVYSTLPIGIAPTERFLFKVLEGLGKEPKLPEPIEKEKRLAVKEIEKIAEHLKGLRVAIISGSTRIAPLTEFVWELGMEPAVVSIDRLGEVTLELLDMVVKEHSLNPRVLKEPDYQEVLDALREEKVDLILGGLYEKSLSYELNVPLYDIMHSEERTMGFKNAAILAQSILSKIKNWKDEKIVEGSGCRYGK
ncbi:MAG: nitrogenase component 1 [Candidatus Baldrarchaeia archaeon]